jgi:phage shock protein A
MAIQLELSAEVEEQLQEKAIAAGLSLECYLLTLIDTVLQPPVSPPPPPALFRFLQSFGIKRPVTEPASSLDVQVRQTIRQMWENVLSSKEQVVAAISKMNLLQTAISEQRQIIAEKELQALCVLQAGDRIRAKQLFLEAMVLEKHLEGVVAELTAATEAAEAIAQVFQQAEKRVKDRGAEVQGMTLKVYQQAMLRPEQVEALTKRLGQEADWDIAFVRWGEQKQRTASSRITKDDLMASQLDVDVEAIHEAVHQWAKEVKTPSELREDAEEGEGSKA